MRTTLKELKLLIKQVVLQEINYRVSAAEEVLPYYKVHQWEDLKMWLEEEIPRLETADQEKIQNAFQNVTKILPSRTSIDPLISKLEGKVDQTFIDEFKNKLNSILQRRDELAADYFAYQSTGDDRDRDLLTVEEKKEFQRLEAGILITDIRTKSMNENKLRVLIKRIILQEINYRISGREEAERADLIAQEHEHSWFGFKRWLETTLNDPDQIQPIVRNVFLRGFRNGSVPQIKPENIDEVIPAIQGLFTKRQREWLKSYNSSPERKKYLDQWKDARLTASFLNNLETVIDQIVDKLYDIKARWLKLNKKGDRSEAEQRELENLNRGLYPQDILPDVKSYERFPLNPKDMGKLKRRKAMEVPF